MSSLGLVRDTSNPPKTITNRNSKIVLGYIDDKTSNEHLNLGEYRLCRFFTIYRANDAQITRLPPILTS